MIRFLLGIIQKYKIIKLCKKVRKEQNLKDWEIKSIDDDFDYKKHGLDSFPCGFIDAEHKLIELSNGFDFNTMATTLLHEVAHVKDESWLKEDPHNENWGLEFTSLVNNYMKIK